MLKKKQVRQPATLDEIRRLMDNVETRTTLNWIFSIGFGFVAMGSGLLASGISLHTENPQYGRGFQGGGIAALVLGFIVMFAVFLLNKRWKKSN